MTSIHPSAVVDPRAELEEGVEIGPGAVIGPEVKIGRGTVIGPHAVLEGRVVIGRGVKVGAQAVLGAAPQDLKYRGGPTAVEIGDGCVLREFVTVHRGTEHGGGLTVVEEGAYLMAYAHVGHDCRVGSGAVLANAVQLGGHVRVGRLANLGGCAAVHQFVRIGDYAFVGGQSAVTMDVPPFCRVAGNFAVLLGLNYIGLRRQGFSEETLRWLRRALRLAFKSGLLLQEAIARLESEIIPHCPEVAMLASFLRESGRGVTR